jgi:phosphoribosylamine--glycine ligase
MISAKDHKKIYEGDKGPNTGGMGSIAPCPEYTNDIYRTCMETVFKPTAEALVREGRSFTGVIFFGLMLTVDGPKVIEYNCRFGDPEAQVVLPMLENDLMEVILACVDGRLQNMDIRWKSQATACVVLASGGYPGKYNKGYEIKGIDAAKSVGCDVFHAGTVLKDNKFYTNGGRVLNVVAYGSDLNQAIKNAYNGVNKIYFDDMYFRRDIGDPRFGL